MGPSDGTAMHPQGERLTDQGTPCINEIVEPRLQRED
jgi:hypothetical protein